MRNRLKRAAAAVITAVMLLTLLSASLASGDGEVLSAPVLPGLEDGGALLNQVQELSNTDENNMTVTFVIGNGDYTSDPGSGETHLTVTAPIENGELTYTKWAGRYKVTGTGTICSYTIPAGSSLTAEGLTTPALTVENIGSSNTFSYTSAYSWVTEGGMVCNASTVFSESTTLYLQLYENSSYYQLDFVCGEENHSIKTVGNFLLEQSISVADIDAATAAAQEFTSQYCTHGVAHGETLTGWQLKVTATGAMVDLVEGLAITSDYVNEQYGSAIKVYAVWESTPVTATFVYDGTTVDSRTLASGSVLGELPDMSAYETEESVFLGWQYAGNDEGNPLYATAETVITADTVYTAVFGEPVYYDVTFHDVLPDDEESDVSIGLLVQEGMTLAQAFALYDDSALEDGAMLSQCVWYTVDESGVKTAVNLSAPVTEELNLYTYTYRIVLTLTPEAAAAAISTFSLVKVEAAADGTMTMTITAREGETLTAADFVVDGVDYSLYAWTDENGDSVNIQSLITNGVTENITATSSSGTLTVTTKQMVINFYVCVDDVWQSTTETVTAYWLTTSDDVDNNSWYLTSGQLQSIYGKYGFQGMSGNTKYFPHATSGAPDSLWADRAAQEVGSVVYSPIINTNASSCNVYYLPEQDVTDNTALENVSDSNTFYTVTVIDPGQKVYTADTLPAVTYTRKDTTASMTVEATDGVTWQCVGRDGTTVPASANGDGTVTFKISAIAQPYVISPVVGNDETMITYNINLPETPADAEYGTPQIEGGSTYMVVVNGEHTVLAPSLLSYFYTSGKYLGEATFLGWAVNGDTENLLQPDASLDLAEYGGQTVTLTAQWSTELGGDVNIRNSTMVNFFVSLEALPEGSTSWQGSTESTAFTESVFTTDCGVTGNDINAPLSGQKIILGGTSGSDLNGNHNEIVSELLDGYDYTPDGSSDTYTFHATFPSDETVLRNIRTMVDNGTEITINGHTITVEELTTSNFTIKWYVFKFDYSDGWHIDGILVAKTGKLVVTKTFAGDEAAINAVKSGFSIAVDGEEGCVHAGKTLTTNDTEGLTVSGNTYTWTLDVDQYYDYTFTEQNYQYTANLCTYNALYRVRNANTSSQNTSGWRSYTSGVTVTGQGYNEGDSDRLTVSFLNTYTAAGTVILQKVDAATGNLMPGVSFTIAKADGSAFTMYDKGNSHYSADPASGGTATTTITTDSAGQAYLWIGGGEYTLHEQVPTGYDDPGTITVVLEGEEGNSYKVISITSLNAQNGEKFVDKDGLTLKVMNYSRTIDLRVTKNWLDNENKPVTIQLYRNGNPMGSSYTVTFDGTVDSVETTAWTHTFTGLPLYADADLAQYTLREEALGDFKYSEAFDGGYQYYDLKYSGMTYLDENGNETTDMTDVATIALSVANRRSTGTMSINKEDGSGNPLAGAVFYLYAAPTNETEVPTVSNDGTGNVLSGMTQVKAVTSGTDGVVSFGTVAAGRYYIIEHTAPDGYTGSNSLYAMQVTGAGSKLQVWTGEAWADVAGNRVANTRITANVTITKQVTGNMGDRSKTFAITVVCTEAMGQPLNGEYSLSANGRTATFSLGHEGSVILQNVPVGAVLTISESGAEDYTMTVTPNDGEDALTSYTVTGTNDAITVENSKSATPDTGVFLDSLPYIVILACVALIVILLLVRRRRDRDDR